MKVEPSLRTAVESGAPVLSFQALLALADARLDAIDVAGAQTYSALAAEAARTPQEVFGARFLAARCCHVLGEVDVAIVLAAEACAAADGDPVSMARAQTLQARCLYAAGETDAALDLALLALQALEAAGRDDDEARAAEQAAMTALGVVYLQLGELQQAMQWCQRGVELARQLPAQAAYGAALDTVACVHGALAERAREAGDAEQALRCEGLAVQCSEEAVVVAQQAGHVSNETSALLNLAESLTLVGEAARALTLLDDWERRYPQALARHRSHHQDSYGQLCLALGRDEDAVAAFERALALGEDEAHRAVILQHLSQALERCGRWREALGHYKHFHRLQTSVSAERAQRSARVAAARVDIERERARARQLTASNAQLQRRAEDLSRQAHEDALTGLPNRRRVEQLLAAWPRTLAVAMVDVDHFKQVNDRFSHAIGDEVLRQLGAILRASIRPADTAARMGGEEFVVLFESGPDAQLLRAAERIRQAVAGHDWTALAAGLQVTVSIGLARADEATRGAEGAEGAEGAGVLETADRRLYAAKRAGRNRVVHAD